ncbi:MAG: carbonic anhydrase [Chitinophagaceae bacterium]|jgi:carbonic anhydrase|nr:carbonic anhydrase [Chitinophagaceae bacterium]
MPKTRKHSAKSWLRLLGVRTVVFLLFTLVFPLLVWQVYISVQTARRQHTGLLQSIMMGNRRFASGTAIHPHSSRQYMHAVSKEQHPTAVVVACADSRVSPELVLDKGIGDLFVIRTAGNMLGELELGSIEYAVEHLQVHLIMVMGHERCGAIKALVEGGEAHGHIKTLIDSLQQEPEIEEVSITDPQRLEHCVRANILHQVRYILTNSPLIKEGVKSGTLQIAAAYYDLDSGRMELLDIR